MDIITYESLYEILRREKYEQELQKIDDDLFKRVVIYMNEKSDLLNKSTQFTLEVEKTKRQIDNIKKIIKEIYERRENKIIQHALFSSRSNEKHPIPLLQEEKLLYDSLLESLNKNRKNVLLNVLSASLPVIEEDKPKELKIENEEGTKLVRFLHAVPKFVGTDLNIYGPFEAEDIGSLPEKITNLLIEKNRAEEIKNDNTKNKKQVL